MDGHACKLCSRTFSDGRALGGHMRSHAAIEHSASLSSSSSEVKQQKLSYALRENPKKSFLMVDPEFSLARGCAAVAVEDWESETESTPPVGRRTRRRCQIPSPSPPKSEPVSSVSETTPDEDVARCLMMLSRDVWIRRSFFEGEEESVGTKNLMFRGLRRPGRGKYQCGTCGKVFRSYQALGGHRASHKKLTTGVAEEGDEDEEGGQRRWGNPVNGGERKIHECPVCLRVFSSGQALGGHKRSHLVSSSGVAHPLSSAGVGCGFKFVGESLLDLNEPPLVDEEEEISDVSEEQGFE